MLGTDRPLGPVRDTQEGPMKDVMVTVSGFVGNNPALHVNPAKAQEWTTFRVASTRRYVNDDGDWTDGRTLWFTVKTWRGASSVARSVHKGDPVVVTGRLEVDEWTGPDGREHSTLVVVASAIGLDATRGRVEFTREVLHGTPAGEADPFEVAAPAPVAGLASDGADVPDDARDLDEEDQGQRELVNA